MHLVVCFLVRSTSDTCRIRQHFIQTKSCKGQFMKGIIFNLMEEAVTSQFGANTWDDLLDAAGLDGAYTSLGNYADEQVFQLVAAASTALKLSPADVLRWFGRSAMPIMAQRYPVFFEGHSTTRGFLVTLNHIIHPEVNKLYPDAQTPIFEFEAGSEETLLVTYYSKRKICTLAEGFMHGAADHYDERIDLEHPQCMHHGAPKCLFKIKFASRATEGAE